MNREPIGLYIFRFILGLGMFAFMAMLYWSSILVENDLKDLRIEIEKIGSDLFILQSEVNKVRTDVLEALLHGSSLPAPSNGEQQKVAIKNNRSQVNPDLPNLLTADAFYSTTLPKILGSDFKPKGTFQSAVVGRPDNLHPFSNWSQVVGWHNMCSVSVARLAVGIYETMAPDMALKVEERKNPETGNLEFWVHLRDGVYWQPLRREWFSEGMKLAPEFLRKHPVTAEDFKFYYDAIMNPFVQEAGAVALRTYLGDIDEVRVIDKLTFVVKWKGREIVGSDGKKSVRTKYVAKQLTGGLKPLASFVYKYFPDGKKLIEDDADPETYRKNSVWAQQFSQHWARNIIVSCGPWVFDSMTDRQIKFRRNPDHFFPYDALAEASEIQFKQSPDTIWEEFKINRLDSYELRPDQLSEFDNFLKSDIYHKQKGDSGNVERVDYVARSYAYIGWNAAKPYFASKKVRQALTMAIDRQRIIRQTLNGMGIEINGTFYRYSPAYDTSIPFWPYNPERAKTLLEEEGWFDSTDDGIIDKVIDGKVVPFQFTLTYFVKNPTTKAICEYVATALKEINIQCTLNGVDIADLSSMFEGKNFDALCLGWNLGTPPDDPRQLWHSSGAKEPGSSNAVGFANAEADAIIEALDYESDPEKRLELYRRFDAIIHNEAPYTFLYTPKTALVYRERLGNVFLPVDRQDLIPGANIAQPEPGIFFLKK